MSSRTLSDVTTKEDDAETVKAVDFVQAAEKGFVATDERGQAIVQLDAAEEARLRSKLDWRIVPPITLVYFMCFIDRSNLGNSRIAHIEQSLNLKGYDFNSEFKSAGAFGQTPLNWSSSFLVSTLPKSSRRHSMLLISSLRCRLRCYASASDRADISLLAHSALGS